MTGRLEKEFKERHPFDISDSEFLKLKAAFPENQASKRAAKVFQITKGLHVEVISLPSSTKGFKTSDPVSCRCNRQAVQ